MRSRAWWGMAVACGLAGCGPGTDGPLRVVSVAADIGRGPAIVVVAPSLQTDLRWLQEVQGGYRLIHVTAADPGLGEDLRRRLAGPVVLAVLANPDTAATVARALADRVVGVIVREDAAKAPMPGLTALVQAHGWPLRRVAADWQDLPWRFWWRDWVAPRKAPFTVIVVDDR